MVSPYNRESERRAFSEERKEELALQGSRKESEIKIKSDKSFPDYV